jgi:signal transduction histidine kinase
MSRLKRILGINRYVLSNTEYKRVLLVSQIALLFIFSMALFTVVDLLSGYPEPVPYNLAAIASGVVVIALNRQGYFLTAMIFLTLAVQAVTLYFTAVLPAALGTYLLAIPINIGILVVYGYDRKELAIGMMMLSSLFYYVLSFHSPFRWLDIEVTPEYITQNLMVSFVIASIAAVMVVYYLMRANLQVESKLTAKDLSLQQRNLELQAANTALDKFFYSVSHDLRAPLTSMQGLIQLMRMSSDAGELKEYAQMLNGRAENLDAFIRKIGDYSKNSQMAIKADNISLRSLIRDNLENFRFYPHASSIRVMLEVPDQLMIQSDAFRLQEVFGNLISNAFKYYDSSKASFIRISSSQTGDTISVTIEDNGIGIREAELPRVFDMFYRANRSAPGTGLGLFIVQETLQKLHGKIEVTSQFGHGTTFRVHLPQLMQASPAEMYSEVNRGSRSDIIP